MSGHEDTVETSAERLENLLERLRAGDIAARDELLSFCCERFKNKASRMLGRFSSVQRWAETDDVLHGALLRLHKSLAQIQPETVRGFLALAAEHIRRELIDLYRKYNGPEGIGANHASVAGMSQESNASARLIDPSDPNPGPPTWADRQEWSGRIHQVIETLSEEFREVVCLKFYHGLGESEIAQIQGVNVRTIRRRWRQARLLLHEALSEEARFLS